VQWHHGPSWGKNVWGTSVAHVSDRRAQVCDSAVTENCAFLTQEIMGAKEFNFASKLLKMGDFQP